MPLAAKLSKYHSNNPRNKESWRQAMGVTTEEGRPVHKAHPRQALFVR